MHKVKIFFLLPHLSEGGQERVASRLSFELSKFRKLYLVFFQEKISYPFKGTFLNLDTPAQRGFFKKTLNFLRRAYRLNNLIQEIEPRCIISFGESANFVNLLAKNNNVKKIISVRQDFFRNFEISSFYKALYTLLIKTLYPKADKIITVSKSLEYELKEFLNLPEEKITTIYNPIEVDEIQLLKAKPLKEFEFLKNFPYLITVGRLTKQKGQWYLLRIFKELKTKHKDLKLVILGKGELKDYLTELAESLGLKTYVWNRDKINPSYDVYFLGFQRNPFKFINHSRLFVFTSLWEGFPNVLIETLAVGKAIISTDCRTGPREILAPNTDFLFQTDKPELAEYGILMPTFERKLSKANDPLTGTEKVWIDTLSEVLNSEKLLKEYEQKVPIRAKDFRIEIIAKHWLKIIETL